MCEDIRQYIRGKLRIGEEVFFSDHKDMTRRYSPKCHDLNFIPDDENKSMINVFSSLSNTGKHRVSDRFKDYCKQHSDKAYFYFCNECESSAVSQYNGQILELDCNALYRKEYLLDRHKVFLKASDGKEIPVKVRNQNLFDSENEEYVLWEQLMFMQNYTGGLRWIDYDDFNISDTLGDPLKEGDVIIYQDQIMIIKRVHPFDMRMEYVPLTYDGDIGWDDSIGWDKELSQKISKYSYDVLYKKITVDSREYFNTIFFKASKFTFQKVLEWKLIG